MKGADPQYPNLPLFAFLLGGLAFPAMLLAAEAVTGDQAPPIGQTAPDNPWHRLDTSKLELRSQAALITDERGHVIYSKNADQPLPIASITKLMTAMVVLDSGVPLDRNIAIKNADRDLVRLTGSRLRCERATLSRRDLLEIALMASENRAAAALGRTTFEGGTEAFVARMNRKAQALGLSNTRFVDATGISTGNVSTASDLVKMLRAAGEYPLIRQATTSPEAEVHPYQQAGALRYVNTNRLLKSDDWQIELSKTGYINESGRCLVMQARLYDRTLDIVLLNSFGKLTPFGDSNRLRKWMGKELCENPLPAGRVGVPAGCES
ncbi:MAG: serine hydrolase [Pseudomonadota bacterium]